LQLLDGVAIRSQVTARQYQYFQIWVSDAQADMDLTITLTPLFGDPGLLLCGNFHTRYSFLCYPGAKVH
jgi:hypothetical protein